MLNSPEECRRVKKRWVRYFFDVSSPAVTAWMPDIERIGAFNEDDRTYDLIKIVQWQCEKARHKKSDDKAALELEKLQKDIDYKEAQITKMLEKYVERSIADQEKVALLKIISGFLEKVPSYRKQLFHMISADVAEKRLRDLFKEAMDQVANAPEEIE